jgi:hypothetical protein
MRRRPLLPAFLLAFTLALALHGAGVIRAQETPMSATNIPADDEPESAGEAPEVPEAPIAAPRAPTPPVAPAAPGAAAPPAPPPDSAGRRAVNAPLPPQRPWTTPGTVTTAPATPPVAPPAAAAPAPAAPAAPAPTLPAPPAVAAPTPERVIPPNDEPPAFEMRPDMRVIALPTQREPATTAEIEAEEERAPEPTFVEKQTDYVDIACIKPEVMALVRAAGEHFGGTPIITSGQRNRGRRGSFHRRCMAADFFVPGIERARLARYLRAQAGAGGVGTYCHTKSVHIDIGEPRNWYQCGRRFRFAQR